MICCINNSWIALVPGSLEISIYILTCCHF
jgi:hypothetical protein